MYGSGCDFKDRDPTAGAGSLAPATPSTCCVKVVQYAAVTAVAAN